MAPQDIPVKYNYRLTFVRDIIRVIIAPPALVHLALSISDLQLPLTAHTITLVLSVPIVYTIRCKWATVLHEREAARRGARLVPVAKGSWPGNLDMLNKLTFWSETRYVG